MHGPGRLFFVRAALVMGATTAFFTWMTWRDIAPGASPIAAFVVCVYFAPIFVIAYPWPTWAAPDFWTHAIVVLALSLPVVRTLSASRWSMILGALGGFLWVLCQLIVAGASV